jgi:OPA family glycerol-3-phosphate transporter-like MFS transporter
MGLVMVAIVLQGALRDGVTNWMPTFVCESFGLDSSSAILTGVLLPIFQIFCSQAAAWLFRKCASHEAISSGVIFAVGTVAAILVALVMQRSVLLTALFMAALAGCMHGVNFVLIGMVPRQFRRFGRVGLVSGVLNSCTYLGSALSTYGVALLSLSLGWSGTITIWIGLALAGAAVCLSITKKWGTFRRNDA